MTTDDELLDQLDDALAPSATGPTRDRVAALRAEVVERFGASEDPSSRGDLSVVPDRTAETRRPRWAVATVAAAVALAAGFALAAVLLPGPIDQVAAGDVEYDGALVATGGAAIGRLEVVEAGIGRVVRIRTDELAILPAGELYEVWFVDDVGTPDERRISAGTFHPFADGSTTVRLAAAVDPAQYPVLEITAEPGDGDPAATGEAVARTELE